MYCAENKELHQEHLLSVTTNNNTNPTNNYLTTEFPILWEVSMQGNTFRYDLVNSSVILVIVLRLWRVLVFKWFRAKILLGCVV